MILMGANAVVTGALLPVIVRDLGLSTSQAGLLVASPAVGYVVALTLTHRPLSRAPYSVSHSILHNAGPI